MYLETKHTLEPSTVKVAKSYDYYNSDFDLDESRYLDRWLCENIDLDERKREPRKITEYKMLKMLRGIDPINMKGVEAYIKWKSAKEAQGDVVRKGGSGGSGKPKSKSTPKLDGSFDDEFPFGGDADDVDKIELRFNSKSRFETTRDFLSGLRKRAKDVGDRVSGPSLWLSTALSTDFSRRFTEWTEWVSQSAPTVYDKAVDSVYNATHEGGSALHRLIDGQHGVFEMWEVVKEALPNDSSVDEIGGYFTALWKDMATPQGIPLVSISRDNYDAVADALSQRLGVPKSWVADAMTVNGAELFASSFGVIALALNWAKDDKERFGDIAATIGLSGAFSANPVLGLVSLISLAKAFQQGHSKQAYTEVLNGIAKGGIGTGIFIGVSSVVGGPTWVGLLLGLCLAVYARNHFDRTIEFKDLVEWVGVMVSSVPEIPSPLRTHPLT